MAKDTAKAKAKNVSITLVRSPIGRKPKHRRTIRALGLRKMHQTVVKEATPAILGMVRSVAFMLDIEEMD